jgi:tetratricopeptide (TPR) repeat protein
MHNLLNAHFDLRNFKQFEKTLHQFERFAKTPASMRYDNFRTHTSIYINSARINYHMMKGTFNEGMKLVPEIESKLKEYSLYVDRHRILVFTYKFASLYFGCGDYKKAIDYLMEIINGPLDLRMDLQCYARLMHLLAHYELGNDELIESLTKSVYRFMVKMKNLTVVEEEIINFLRSAFNLWPRQLKPALEKLLEKIKHLEKNRYETRAFAYLDIVSWVESKVQDKPMSEVIYNKYQQSKHRGKKLAVASPQSAQPLLKKH